MKGRDRISVMLAAAVDLQLDWRNCIADPTAARVADLVGQARLVKDSVDTARSEGVYGRELLFDSALDGVVDVLSWVDEWCQEETR